MGARTGIEWTGATWTPIRARTIEPQSDGSGKERVGWHCEHVSEGCRNCYAEAMNRRLGTGLAFKPAHLYRPDRERSRDTQTAILFLDEDMLIAPLTWKKPRLIFPCSMTDIAADFVPDSYLEKMFAVMALTPHHTYQIVTKRPERLRDWLNSDPRDAINGEAGILHHYDAMPNAAWPLPNVWIGTSVEDQASAEARIPVLLDTPAAVRWISAEPLLGSVDVESWLLQPRCYGDCRVCRSSMRILRDCQLGNPASPCLDWVVCGGESGPNARPMNPQWARDLRDQCAVADVPFLFKQWGEWVSVSEVAGDGRHFKFPDGRTVSRIGKKAAGRSLDGVTHHAFPAGASA